MANSSSKYLVLLRNIILVLLLFLGLRWEAADPDRYGLLLALMLMLLIWVRLRDFPFFKDEKLLRLSSVVDPLLIRALDYHTLSGFNPYFYLLYLAAMINVIFYLPVKLALAVNLFTVLVIASRYLEPLFTGMGKLDLRAFWPELALALVMTAGLYHASQRWRG